MIRRNPFTLDSSVQRSGLRILLADRSHLSKRVEVVVGCVGEGVGV